MQVQSVGVIGAGVIGVGVAQNLAQTNHRTIVIDVSDEKLNHARQEIRNNIRLQSLFKGEKRNPAEILERIEFSTDFQALSAVDFVVENVVEKWEVKEQVWRTLDEVCPPPCIFAANTSAISITRLASVTKRPTQVVGIHFMNPVPLKPTVEVIYGYHTSPETVEVTKSLLESMGKDCVIVNDSAGFVSNRVLMLTINEAIFLVQEQVASAEDIDTIFKRCFEHKMGPLETADLIGLDTILYSIDVLHESFNDSKYRPCPLLKKMVDAGLLGRKSGKGFYTYQ
jgi:3-hydroxybutyryl-CoA dehydrogenase